MTKDPLPEKGDNISLKEDTRGFTSEEVSADRYPSFRLNPQEIHQMAFQTIPQGARVLDVGCGAGEVSVALRDQLNCTVLGIEPNKERAQSAQENGIEIISSYLTEDSIRRLEPFDIVTFLDVLEHVSDPVELLNTALPALKPEGRIIVSTPNVAHWSIRLKLLFGNFDYEPTGIMDATHLRWFTQKTIQNVVTSAGFKTTHLDVSRGHWLNVYHGRSPWKWFSKKTRKKIVNRLCKTFPRLFGCQHFLVAEKP